VALPGAGWAAAGRGGLLLAVAGGGGRRARSGPGDVQNASKPRRIPGRVKFCTVYMHHVSRLPEPGRLCRVIHAWPATEAKLTSRRIPEISAQEFDHAPTPDCARAAFTSISIKILQRRFGRTLRIGRILVRGHVRRAGDRLAGDCRQPDLRLGRAGAEEVSAVTDKHGRRRRLTSRFRSRSSTC
jgi:hypothetical protein